MTQRARSLIIKTKGDLMIQVAFIILAVRISRVVYSLFDKSTFEVSHKELSCSTTYGV